MKKEDCHVREKKNLLKTLMSGQIIFVDEWSLISSRVTSQKQFFMSGHQKIKFLAIYNNSIDVKT